MRGEHLTLGYRHRVVVQDLSFEIHRRDILGIVGPNGCGKTTLLRTILGLIQPLRGSVDRDPTLIVSYVPQRDRLDTMLPITALEVVLMGRTARAGVLRRTHATDRDAARRALARVDAESLGPQLFRNLSGGQQQRVLLARALAAEPDVLVLDEPTAGMDIASEAAILAFLQDLNRTRGVTILIVTHLLSLVLNFATSIMLMGARRDPSWPGRRGPQGRSFDRAVRRADPSGSRRRAADARGRPGNAPCLKPRSCAWHWWHPLPRARRSV